MTGSTLLQPDQARPAIYHPFGSGSWMARRGYGRDSQIVDQGSICSCESAKPLSPRSLPDLHSFEDRKLKEVPATDQMIHAPIVGDTVP